MNIRLNIALVFSLLLAVWSSTQAKELPFTPEFSSDFEALTFSGERCENPLQYFLAMETGMDSRMFEQRSAELDAVLEDVLSRVDRSARGWKQVRAILSGLDRNFFREYAQIASVGETLREGRFNCVSGTALLGMALDRMGIPYHVVATANHVYLHARLDGHWYRVEPTAPANEIFRVRDQLAKEGRPGMEFLDLRGLAGLQYYNAGLVAMDEEQFEQAMDLFLKSGLLYRGQRVHEMQAICASELVAQARGMLLEGQHTEALRLLRKAACARSEDGPLRQLALVASLAEVEALGGSASTRLARMDRLEIDLGFLKAFPEWRGARADLLLAAAAGHYRDNALDQGRMALMEFEQLLLTEIEVDGNAGGWVYAEAFNSLLRNQHYAEARHVLLSGLSQFPGHQGLMERQSYMSSDLALVQSPR